MKYKKQLVIAFTILAICSVYFLNRIQMQSQKLSAPNDYEYFYASVAQHTGYDFLCEKISDTSVNTSSWTASGYQVAYTKSDCYYQTAINYNRPELCSNVVRAYKLFLNGSAYTKEKCMEKVNEDIPNKISRSGVNNETMILVMKEMGYTSDDIKNTLHEGEITGNEKVDFIIFFLEIKDSEDFRERLYKLPSF